MIVVWLFLMMPWVCLQFVIVAFPDHTPILFFSVIVDSLLIVAHIVCFLFVSLLWGGGAWSLLCYEVPSVVSSFAII